jgi:hypothetical protein
VVVLAVEVVVVVDLIAVIVPGEVVVEEVW